MTASKPRRRGERAEPRRDEPDQPDLVDRSDRSDRSQRLRIVYIAGAKNCGSTLLDAILGNAADARSLGEVGGFHRFRPDAPCACRRGPCEACLGVGCALERAGVAAEFAQLSRLPLKERAAHWTVVSTKARRRYAQVADLALESAAATTGRRVLIDSSKNAARAAALAHDSRHDVRVIHMVRDGRGYLRSRRSRAAVDGTRHVAAFAMLGWLAKNLLIGAVLGPRLGADRYLVCRYEDLVRDPESTLEHIGAFSGLDVTGLVAAATTGQGVVRHHLYEPVRRTDYRCVRLDPARLRSQRETRMHNLAFWVLGGFVSARWGYDRRQSYLSRSSPAAADVTGGSRVGNAG